MLPATARILDANFNRAREALRVLEDYARFQFDHASTSSAIKNLRHELAVVYQSLDAAILLANRNTAADVGTTIKAPDEFTRTSSTTIISANAKRLTEALRVLEETTKLDSPALAEQLEALRYRAYSIEKLLYAISHKASRLAEAQLYVLLTESLCRQPWLQVLKSILAAGTDVVQLREKHLPDAELLNRARQTRELCRQAGAIFILNDRPDIALLAGADGVHVGQSDLPTAELRRLLGGDMLIGVSTSRLAEAQHALEQGASYIAAGPMFATSTKAKDLIAGPRYAAEASRWAAERNIPCVAIGGITPENTSELTAVGIRTVAVCSAVIAANDPATQCQRIKACLAASLATA
ncbi:MAG: thiamine phosphate synthase [Phycisphaerales bacterium]|nr:thiamine phosphate synthase [Phycisphaerales bacterium]